MEGRLLARARARQAEIRSGNRAAEFRRREEIAERCPEIAEIEKKLRSHMHELVGLALGQPGRGAAELEAESLALQERRRSLLREAGYPEDYLDPIFDCPKCRDTGWVGERMCECLVRLYKQAQTEELSPLLRNGNETFEAFRLDYYSAAATPGREDSPRDQMRLVLYICRSYAETFGPESDNLLFTGAPGLGKTFLSAAIARVVAEKGAGVAYDTVTPMLGAFERERFSRDPDEQADAASRVRQLLSCDLLILDDLGTEMVTSFVQSALYQIVNGRLIAGKQTIISTNLNPAEIGRRYSPQILSRLEGEYQILPFFGEDIRQLKRERE